MTGNRFEAGYLSLGWLLVAANYYTRHGADVFFWWSLLVPAIWFVVFIERCRKANDPKYRAQRVMEEINGLTKAIKANPQKAADCGITCDTKIEEVL